MMSYWMQEQNLFALQPILYKGTTTKKSNAILWTGGDIKISAWEAGIINMQPESCSWGFM
jgi:hypothetical protein